MATNIPHKNRFYLGFNQHTGQLVDVIAPDGKKVVFGPEQFNRLNSDECGDEELKKILSNIWVKIRENSIPEINLSLADKPGNTICGGSCGGIPFWMCG